VHCDMVTKQIITVSALGTTLCRWQGIARGEDGILYIGIGTSECTGDNPLVADAPKKLFCSCFC
jgi:hypothetical protein